MKLKTLSDIQDPSAPFVILMHGYGADAQDLYSLSEVIPTKRKFNYVFPEAPLKIPLGPHWVGHAWWNIDLARLQNPALDHDISVEVPPELKKTRALVTEMLQDLKVPTSQIIIGGFSQGGMCAVDQVFMSGLEFKAMALLSTALINKAEYKSRLQQAPPRKIPYFLSHGEQDPVLKIKFSDQLHSLLNQNGFKGERHVFRGGHEIPMSILQRFGAWLDSLV